MLRSDSESMFCYRFRFNCDRPFSESMTNMASCTLKPQLCTHSLFPLASHLHGICKVFQPHGTCKIRLQWVRHHLHCHTLTQKWESWKRPHHARSTTLQLRSNCLPSQTSRHPDRCGFGASRHPSNQPVLHDGIRLIGNCSLDSSGIFHSSSAGPLREHLTTQDVLVPVPGTGVLPAPRVPCQQQLVCHNSSA